jgi:DNA-binding SARP family transcriptional activator
MADVELVTRSTSYILQVEPAKTDVWYFKEQVNDARERAREGNLNESVLSLRSGLSVWRGKPLTGVSGDYFQRERQFLEDEWIVAQEELFNAEMALGKHRAILPELQKLASVHQFHETLRAQLMLALYRSGRQVDALQAYLLIQRQLREDLGIEPGLELQRLYKAILEQVPPTRITLSSSSLPVGSPR